MTASILHRITGGALYFGMVLAVCWLAAAAAGPDAYAFFGTVAGSWPGIAVLVLATYGLFLHLLGGIRHFIWDLGFGLKPHQADALAVLSLAGAAVLTAFLWGVVWVGRS